MIVLKVVGIWLFCAIVLLVIGIAFLHYRTQNKPAAKEFLAGSVPSPLPDGFYRGSVSLQNTTWRGKFFDQKNTMGINMFQNPGQAKISEAYPFSSYEGESSVDKGLRVLKIDYDLAGNPWYLRLVVDEVVETRPGHYLGKLIVRLSPTKAIALGYFELDKDATK